VNFDEGLDVPIPTFPAFVTTKFVAVDDPITNEFPSPATGLIASFAQGEVEPIDAEPKYEAPETVRAVDEAYGKTEAMVEVALKRPKVSCSDDEPVTVVPLAE
jgi:hypothetical protein